MADLNIKHNRVVWIDIPVADLERAAAFYSKVLAIQVSIESFGESRFAVLEHSEGNGGCLVVEPDAIQSTGGVLVYLNTDGRIRDAIARSEASGGKIVQPIQTIGPHGFRAIIQDSEGNRIALHSQTDA